ncbi:CATRA system-associated protein [Actinophytocola oryzae]|uniref:CobQ/CobB/MinD/ParA family nucleotide binding protein n=1 Tax=Actinophytocola oryzae TaxID=502181 RepID=A0A4R7UU22_9PSEU|nr:CATRA system-associated protein [Actinophytocola oryzae]TDV38652.1 CobQ/CobB/MinD/ParA family nucleotide binding protein [Actinophytocola oryzae]
MDGTIVTFYSYKGGVGRSFTLANIAILLARWGHRVLTIDWDLEAPGLHEYFAPLLSEPPRTGLVDLVSDFTTGGVGATSNYITKLSSDDGVVDLMAAGRRDEDYARRVQNIDWADLYEHGFADVLERLRKDWVTDYDFVLIDSRTGWADIASICTAHLPDRLVLVFTANDQSVGGAVDVAKRAAVVRDRMPYDRPKLPVLPVLSRFDSRVEYKRAETWYQTCTAMTTPLFSNWLVKHVSPALMLRHLTLPYVSYWSFGEQLPVLEETTPSADQIAYALETVAAIVAHRFDRTDLLADNRDAYVASAQGQARTFELDMLVSSPRSAERLATELVNGLREHGIRANRSLSGDIDFLGTKRDTARHLCLVIDDKVSRWQTAEAEWFLRRTLVAEDRRLFPVLTDTTSSPSLPGFLRNIRRLELGPGVTAHDIARQLRGELGGEPVPEVDGARTFADTVAVLERTRQVSLSYDGWFLVQQTLRTMSPAVAAGEFEQLRTLTQDLDLAVRNGAGSGYPTPPEVQDLVAGLISEIRWRGKKLP